LIRVSTRGGKEIPFVVQAKDYLRLQAPSKRSRGDCRRSMDSGCLHGSSIRVLESAMQNPRACPCCAAVALDRFEGVLQAQVIFGLNDQMESLCRRAWTRGSKLARFALLILFVIVVRPESRIGELLFRSALRSRLSARSSAGPCAQHPAEEFLIKDASCEKCSVLINSAGFDVAVALSTRALSLSNREKFSAPSFLFDVDARGAVDRVSRMMLNSSESL